MKNGMMKSVTNEKRYQGVTLHVWLPLTCLSTQIKSPNEFKQSVQLGEIVNVKLF